MADFKWWPQEESLTLQVVLNTGGRSGSSALRPAAPILNPCRVCRLLGRCLRSVSCCRDADGERVDACPTITSSSGTSPRCWGSASGWNAAQPCRCAAYIRQTADVSHGFEGASTATDIGAAVGAVRTLLEALLDADSAGDAPDESPNNPSSGHGLATEGPGDGPDGGRLASTNGADPGH